MSDALILIADDGAPRADAALTWVRFTDGAPAQQGHDARWPETLAAAGGRALLLLPATAAPVRWTRFEGLPPAQAAGAAAHAVLNDRLDDRATLHSAASACGDGSVAATAVDKAWLAGWLDMLSGAGADVIAAVPLAALIPPPAENGLRSLTIGAAGAVRSDAHGFADDPALIAALGSGSDPATTDGRAVADALAAAIDAPPLDLRNGPFARRPASALSPQRRTLLMRLAAALLIVSALVPLVELVRWTWATGEADDASVAMAARAGVKASDAKAAEAALDARLAARGGGPLALSVPLSGLIDAMQPVPGVAVQALAHRADGTLSVTLAAPRVDDINAVLLALQAKNYIVSAQPMTGTDGLQKASITVRALP